MKKLLVVTISMLALMMLSGCAVTGGVLGAGVGMALDPHHPGRGALIGAGVGSAIGYEIDYSRAIQAPRYAVCSPVPPGGYCEPRGESFGLISYKTVRHPAEYTYGLDPYGRRHRIKIRDSWTETVPVYGPVVSGRHRSHR